MCLGAVVDALEDVLLVGAPIAVNRISPSLEANYYTLSRTLLSRLGFSNLCEIYVERYIQTRVCCKLQNSYSFANNTGCGISEGRLMSDF